MPPMNSYMFDYFCIWWEWELLPTRSLTTNPHTHKQKNKDSVNIYIYTLDYTVVVVRWLFQIMVSSFFFFRTVTLPHDLFFVGFFKRFLLRISAGFSHQAALHDFVQPFAAAPSGLGVLTASALAVVLDEVAGPYDLKDQPQRSQTVEINQRPKRICTN